MKPAAFDYVVADSIDAAVAALAAADGEAKLIAGGQSLVPMLNISTPFPQSKGDRLPIFKLPHPAQARTQD